MIDTALIIAAGECERWGGRTKQLMPIGNETVIGRMIRQLRERGLKPIVVTHKPDLLAACGGGFVPAQHGTLLETVLSTRPLWHGVVAVFFGDVIFTEEALDMAMAHEQLPAFFGNRGENFIIMFDDLEGMHAALATTIAGNGIMSWHLYRQLEGLPHHLRNEVPDDTQIYVYVMDDTDDIDTPEKYAKVLKRFGEG